ncbi:CDF family zinc transporter CzcD, partial [Pseudomonas aeruginosa]
MSAGHEHSFAQTNSTRLKWALLLTGSFLVAEVGGGILTGSLALISDAAHMLTDAVALAIALAAINIARRPTNDRLTYGYHRFEILAAAFNAFLLFGVAFYILYAAYERLNQPAEIQSVGMLVIAVLGLLVNLASMRLLAPAQGNSLNVKGAYLEVWSDMLGSLGVIVAAIVIRFTGWAWVDSLVAVLIGFWVLPRTWILLRESLHVLLEGVPKEIQLAELREALLGIPGVTGLHDLH